MASYDSFEVKQRRKEIIESLTIKILGKKAKLKMFLSKLFL